MSSHTDAFQASYPLLKASTPNPSSFYQFRGRQYHGSTGFPAGVLAYARQSRRKLFGPKVALRAQDPYKRSLRSHVGLRLISSFSASQKSDSR